MAISQKRYIEITTVNGGSNPVSAREFIARLYTHSEDAPFGKILEFTSLAKVGYHFGTESDEYKWADKYFSFISKSNTKAKKISFARTTTVAIAPYIKSSIDSKISVIKAITDGSIELNVGGNSYTIEHLDFSSCNTLAEAGVVLQEEINGLNDDPLLTSAVIHLESSKFTLIYGEIGACDVQYAKGTVAVAFGFDISGAGVVSLGGDAETLTQALTRTTDISNNFGSMVFMYEINESKFTEIVNWIDDQNFLAFASIGVTRETAALFHSVATGKDGIVLTLTTTDGHEEFIPCAILACIDYDKENATQNFMYQQVDDVEASVTTDEDADYYDDLKVNYYGATQQAGKSIAFYQRGVMQGEQEDIGCFCNEMWLKDAIAVDIFNVLLAVGKVPANKDGADMIRGVVTNEINYGITNGTIILSKELSKEQKSYITLTTGDDSAWVQVYANGYYLVLDVEKVDKEYKIVYTLIYSKGDSIKKVEGTHILI